MFETPLDGEVDAKSSGFFASLLHNQADFACYNLYFRQTKFSLSIFEI